MKRLTEFLLIVLLTGCAYIVGRNVGLHQHTECPNDLFVVKTDTVRITDTIERPVPYRVSVVRHDTILSPGDTVFIPIQSKAYRHVVAEDSIKGTIDVVASGYNISLDSLVYNFDIKKETIRVTNRKRWGVTVGPQIGVGYAGKRLNPYVGIGVTYGFNF